MELKPPELVRLLVACPGMCGLVLMVRKAATRRAGRERTTVHDYSLRIIEEVVKVMTWLSGLSARPENSLPLIS